MIDMFPPIDGLCSCGCGEKLTGRKTRWTDQSHADRLYESFAIIKGDNTVIRRAVFARDKGFCFNCAAYDDKWQADHILPVEQGGGACGLENFQTLCEDCHKEKTRDQLMRKTTSQ